MGWSRRHVGLMSACAVLAGCTGQSPDPDQASPSEPDEQALPLTDPGDGGEVSVAETGVSMVEDPEGRPIANFAVVVGNDSALVAAEVSISVTMVDSAGDPVADEVNEDTQVSHRIPVVMPGATAGMGFNTIVDSDVDSIKVSVEEVQWWPADNTQRPFAELSVSDISADFDDGAAEIDFSIDSGYSDRLDEPDAAALFRDESKTLLGGSGVGDYAGSRIAVGESDHSLTVRYAVPADADPEQTQVFAYPSGIS